MSEAERTVWLRAVALEEGAPKSRVWPEPGQGQGEGRSCRALQARQGCGLLLTALGSQRVLIRGCDNQIRLERINVASVWTVGTKADEGSW